MGRFRKRKRKKVPNNKTIVRHFVVVTAGIICVQPKGQQDSTYKTSVTTCTIKSSCFNCFFFCRVSTISSSLQHLSLQQLNKINYTSPFCSPTKIRFGCCHFTSPTDDFETFLRTAFLFLLFARLSRIRNVDSRFQ